MIPQLKSDSMESRLELETILGSSTSKICQVACTQDCLLYLAGSTIVFYNPVVDEQICFLQHPSPHITCIAISPCQQYLAVSSLELLPPNAPDPSKNSVLINESEYSTQSKVKKSTNTVTTYRLGEVGLEKPEMIHELKGHRQPIDHLLYSPDSKYLVSISNGEGSMFVWNCTSGERISQNKNSRKILCARFLGRCEDGKVYDLVTSGRGFCKIWPFIDPQSRKFGRVYEEEHWMLVGRTVPLSRKLTTKQFLDIAFWKHYIILLTHDGLLCLICAAQPKEEKLEKCIDLMIERTVSMDIYRGRLMCGGHNSHIKIIDLESLSLVSRFPKPPPLNKENISGEDEAVVFYGESEDFPQCVGIKTIGSDFSQFIVTLYENLTMFIWRPEPTIAAMRSIITHRASVQSIRILDQLSQELTFFGTLSSDSTARVWHIYKKLLHNRESIDLASLIGIKRNAYCRNLTRILYLQAEKQVTHMASAGTLDSLSMAFIAQKELLIYSLDDFELIGHETFDQKAVSLQIKDETAYIGFQNGKVAIYQLLLGPRSEEKAEGELEGPEEESACSVSKVREIQFDIKIKDMKIVKKQSEEDLLLILTEESHEMIIYSLQKSVVIHLEKSVWTCCCDNSHAILCKVSDGKRALYTHSFKKAKTTKFLLLAHQLDEHEHITHLRSNSSLILILTSSNRIILCNFAPAVICVHEPISEPINDLQLSENGEVLMVGEHGNIRVYRVAAKNEGFQEMEGQVKKWMEKNDLSWLDNSVWAKKRSSMEGDKSACGNKLLLGSVESVRLRRSNSKAPLTPVHSTDSHKQVLNGVNDFEEEGMGQDRELPDVQIQYKSEKNDHSIFNPNKIKQQMKGIMANLSTPSIIKEADGLKEQKGDPSLTPSSIKPKEQQPYHKRRIFGSSGSQQQQNSRLTYNKLENNLVDSVVHSFNPAGQKQQTFGEFEEGTEPAPFRQTPQLGKADGNVFQEKTNSGKTAEFCSLADLEELLSSQQYMKENECRLKPIYQKMKGFFERDAEQMVPVRQVQAEIDQLAKELKVRLKPPQDP